MNNRAGLVKIFGFCIFTILMMLGILYLLAAPVNPSLSLMRLMTGTILIIIAMFLLITFLFISNRIFNKDILVKNNLQPQERNISIKRAPLELICQECGNLIKITDDLLNKNDVICEKCGNLIKIPKDNLNW
ncbi:MAG: hypothetical protein ACTSVV_18825 [Promethearchaeota archaeon]